MARAKIQGQVILWAIAAAIVLLTVAVMLSASTTRHAEASTSRDARPNAPRTAVFTDTYDLSGINDSQPSASFLGTYGSFPCTAGSNGTQIVNNATFYRAGLSNPASDVDWYRVQLGAQLGYTITVNQQTSSDLQFTINLFDPVNNIIFSQSSIGSGVIPFYSPGGGSFYLQVFASNATTITDTENKTYQAFLCSSATFITPTPTNLAPTLTPSGLTPDPYAPNETIAESAIATGTRGTPSFVSVGQRIDNLNFTVYPGRSEKTASWFEFYGRAGSIYQVTTLNVQPGVETRLSVYKPVADFNNPNLVFVAPLSGYTNPNNRFQDGVRGSQVVFQIPSSADGLYWILIQNFDLSPRVPGQTYSLQVQEILQATATGATATITPLPATTTPYPGQPDKFEYNGDFDHATLIAPNVKYDGLSFVPFQPQSQNDTDNDYYKLAVKQGIYYTCQTLELAPGVDTNMIVYNQDHVGIGGNDDISPDERAKGNFASRFPWLSSYTGWAYVLVGEVNPPRANEAGGSNYSLRCDIGLPATETPTATLQVNPSVTGIPFVPNTPLPPEPSMTPYPTPRSAENLPVREISNAAATSTPQPTATARSVALSVQIFNDLNKNGLLDPGEGITGVSVRLIDEQSGEPLAQTLTDADGRVNLNVDNPGPVRLSVPLFGYSLLVNETALTVRIAVVSAATLPVRIP